MKGLTLFEKIFAIQAALDAIVKSKENPFFKSNYFDINVVIAYLRPRLKEAGLIVLQPLSHIEGKPAIRTVIVDQETGTSFADIYPLKESKNIQDEGSIITYTRRYALVSMFLLEGEEDDDGNASAGLSETKTTTKTCSECGKPSGNYSKCYSCNNPAKKV